MGIGFVGIREREEKMRILTGENGFMVCRVRVWDLGFGVRMENELCHLMNDRVCERSFHLRKEEEAKRGKD